MGSCVFIRNFTLYFYTEGHKIKRGYCFSATQFPVQGYTLNNRPCDAGSMYLLQNRYLLTHQTELCDEAQFEINLNIYVLQHTQFY